jgi:hypothetical protein
MRLSACITINDRDVSVLDTVFESMRGQDFDEFIIVLDRVPGELAGYCGRWWSRDERVKFVEVAGSPGWRSPVKAWNRGYAEVTGDLLYCFSSETTQAAGNIEKARKMLTSNHQRVIFGKCECSCGPYGQEVNWNGTAPGNLLCDAAHPRPLGFIWAGPMANVRKIGGWDEEFDRGLWYDETDFFIRMWQTELDFVFDDSISGTHLHHPRPVLETTEGAALTAVNLAYITRKYGHMPQIDPPHFQNESGRTTWLNPARIVG